LVPLSEPKNSVTGEQFAVAEARELMAVVATPITLPRGTILPLACNGVKDNLGSVALVEQVQRFPVVPVPARYRESNAPS
jgi:hypothetical protein